MMGKDLPSVASSEAQARGTRTALCSLAVYPHCWRCGAIGSKARARVLELCLGSDEAPRLQTSGEAAYHIVVQEGFQSILRTLQ